jgi:probable HAF family extracellular repeat protein
MRLLVVLAAVGSIASQASAVASFTALNAGFTSVGISGDGSTVVGNLPGFVGPLPARWRPATGAVAYPFANDPFNEPRGTASSSSHDGEIFGGNIQPTQAFDDSFPYRCSSTGCINTLGNSGVNDSVGNVLDVSSDALYGTGFTFDATGDHYRAVHWRPDGTFVPVTPYTPEEVGFQITLSQGSAISGDGTRVAGITWTPDGGLHQEAFTWHSSGAFQRLGDLAGGTVFSQALGISADGSTIVGSSSSALGGEAFLWTAGGGMVALGDLAGGGFGSFATDASANGSVIVGGGSAAAGLTAFIWDSVNGMRPVQDVLASFGVDLTGWRLTSVTGISDDGRVLTGLGINPSGQTRSWYAVLPEPGTAVLIAFGLLGLGVRRPR